MCIDIDMFAGAGCSDVRNARRMRRVYCRLRSEWPGSSGQYFPELKPPCASETMHVNL